MRAIRGVLLAAALATNVSAQQPQIASQQPAQFAGGEISGTVIDAAGLPVPEYFVLVFPTDRRQWLPSSPRMREPIHPDKDGKWRMTKVPAGEYYIAVLSRYYANNLYDVAFLDQVAGAALKFTLADGEKKIQDMRVGRR